MSNIHPLQSVPAPLGLCTATTPAIRPYGKTIMCCSLHTLLHQLLASIRHNTCIASNNDTTHAGDTITSTVLAVATAHSKIAHCKIHTSLSYDSLLSTTSPHHCIVQYSPPPPLTRPTVCAAIAAASPPFSFGARFEKRNVSKQNVTSDTSGGFLMWHLIPASRRRFRLRRSAIIIDYHISLCPREAMHSCLSPIFPCPNPSSRDFGLSGHDD